MSGSTIRFNDGAGYERSMGAWSRLAGDVFLDWIAPAKGLRWIDVGCGNGAFTELMMQRCAPSEVVGIDPSEAQLDFARQRPGAAGARFIEGSAMSLPFEAGSFDVAAMALVIFFVPDPAKGASELARVLRPGGQAVAYAWDFLRGGFPYEPIQAELRALGIAPMRPPHPQLGQPQELARLWSAAGFVDVETRDIEVTRRFADFEEFWTLTLSSTAMKDNLAALSDEQLASVRQRLDSTLPRDASGAIAYASIAGAVRGRLPA